MRKLTFSLFAGKNRKSIILLAPVLLMVFFCATTRFDFDGPLKGLYLLHGEKGCLFELKHDIVFGEYRRLIGRVEFEALHARWRSEKDADKGKPYLKYQWNEKAGGGYFLTFFPDGSKFLACFGRFVDDGNKPVKGLFVGGGLPYSHYETDDKLKRKETGVAFYNGKKWHHLWRNANEAIFPASNPGGFITPGSWKFLGSRVLFASQYQLIIKSSHLVRLDTAPVRLDRYLIYHAGDRFFTLINRMTNIGKSPVSYCYAYGDEPWVGDFGTAAGNIGWTRDRPYYYESHIDLTKNSYAGIYNAGNPVIRESDRFTGLANFIEWGGDAPPDSAYFSNRIGVEPSDNVMIPLGDKFNRTLLLKWSNREIPAGQSNQMFLTIGMADNDPKTGFPRKPPVQLDKSELEFIKTQ
jgi:hypothetical protein